MKNSSAGDATKGTGEFKAFTVATAATPSYMIRGDWEIKKATPTVVTIKRAFPDLSQAAPK